MTDFLAQFIRFINNPSNNVNLDEGNGLCVANFIKKQRNAVYLFKTCLLPTLELSKKLNVKHENLSTLLPNDAKKFFEESLFEVNEINLKKYSEVYGSFNRPFSCLENDEKNFRYIASGHANVFLRILLSLTQGSFKESSTFLFKVLYLPLLDFELKMQYLNRINDNSLDYAELIKDRSALKFNIEFERIGGDDNVKLLIKKKKLTQSWNNLVVATYLMVDEFEEDDFLIEFINETVKTFERLDGLAGVDNVLNDYAKFFLLYCFENERVLTDVFKTFTSVVEKNFSVVDCFYNKYFETIENVDLDQTCLKWSVEKCADMLLYFGGMSYQSNVKYSSLICYLVKRNVREIMGMFNELYNPEVIDVDCDEDGLRWPIYDDNLGMYAALLFNRRTIHDDDLILNGDDIDFILEKLHVEDLKNIFKVWSQVYKKESKRLIEGTLLRKEAIRKKLLNNDINLQCHIIEFMAMIKDFAEKEWLKQVFLEKAENNKNVLEEFFDMGFLRQESVKQWNLLCDYFNEPSLKKKIE